MKQICKSKYRLMKVNNISFINAYINNTTKNIITILCKTIYIKILHNVFNTVINKNTPSQTKKDMNV